MWGKFVTFEMQVLEAYGQELYHRTIPRFFRAARPFAGRFLYEKSSISGEDFLPVAPPSLFYVLTCFPPLSLTPAWAA